MDALPFTRLFRCAQSAQAGLDLGQQVDDAVGVVSGIVEVALCLVGFHLKTSQIGRMLEEPAPFFRLAGWACRMVGALANDGIGLPERCSELMDVFQPDTWPLMRN
ncbi:MAG: hypothetical protein R2855_09725 [Thermomicrobiales bacterium]